MTLNRITIVTAYTQGFIDREEFMRMHAEQNAVAGDRLEDLCESVQDAVNEVIRVAREHGRCRRVFGDLNIEAYAHKYPAGGISWGVDSLITHVNTKRGIVG
jgi:hypothetical protein